MIRSMTGFGRAEVDAAGRTLTAEIRTVNHRYLDFSIRLPQGFQSLESRLRSFLGESMTRGKVSLTVSWKDDPGQTAVVWNEALATQVHRTLSAMRERFGFREPVTLSHLLSNPDIWEAPEGRLEEDEAWSVLQTVVGRAARDLLSMREKEGRALEQDFRRRLSSLGEALDEAGKRAPLRVREAKEKMRARVAELLRGEGQVDEERITVEAAFQADRMDFTEECVRLRSHLDQFEELISADENPGRKLNFLLQEMNREANTIGSKCNDAAIAGVVIRLKEDIEILREQVQNIE